MIMNNEQDVYLENELLCKIDMEDYDIERTYFMVLKSLKRYKRLKCRCFNEPQIRITTKYKYIFVDESNFGNNQYTKIDKYIDDKAEYLKLSEQIALITNLMTEEEKAYFTICLYNGLPEIKAYQEIGCSNRGLIPIKSSCIIKYACAFNLEIYKGELLNDKDDEMMFESNSKHYNVFD